MRTFHLSPDDVLKLDMDLDQALPSVRASSRVKGMFMNPLVKELGSEWAALSQQLEQPPRMGKYLPFSDYPTRDMTRLMFWVGERQLPELGTFERFRRLSRRDFHVFGASTLGRVILATVGDPVSALLRTPDVYAKVAPAEWDFSARKVDAQRVELELNHAPAIWSAQLGQFEAIVTAFGARPETQVSVEEVEDGELRVRFVVSCLPEAARGT